MLEAVIGLIAAFITALPSLLTSLMDAVYKNRRRTALNDLKLRIELLEAWMRASQSLGAAQTSTFSEDAQCELNWLLSKYRHVSHNDRSLVLTELDDIGLFRRGLLLYTPRTTRERWLHGAFYLNLILPWFFIIGAAIPEEGAEPSLDYLATNPLVLLGVVPFTILALILQQVADRMRREKESAISRTR